QCKRVLGIKRVVDNGHEKVRGDRRQQLPQLFVSLHWQARVRGILIVSDGTAKGYQGTRAVGVGAYCEFLARVDIEASLVGKARYCHQDPWRAVAHSDERCETLLGVRLGNDLSIRPTPPAERRWAKDCASLGRGH